MDKLPKEIWLQTGDDQDNPLDLDNLPPVDEDLTWCVDKIHEGDTRYLLANDNDKTLLYYAKQIKKSLGKYWLRSTHEALACDTLK